MLRLDKELEAKFIAIVEPNKVHKYVETLAEAQGLQFLCPKCYAEKGSRPGVHSIICWFRGRGVPDDEFPKPGRWTPSGDSLTNLSFVPGDPPHATSVLLTGGCGWHGYVTNGEAG